MLFIYRSKISITECISGLYFKSMECFITVFLLQACSSRSDEIQMDNLGATVSNVLKNAIEEPESNLFIQLQRITSIF